MTKKVAILCGGAGNRNEWPGSEYTVRELDILGRRQNVNLKIEDISRQMSQSIPDEFIDLVEIASYVYCADQYVARGGKGLENWRENRRRDFLFVIPVRKPDIWNSNEMLEALKECLDFLSDDYYDFDFVEFAKDPPKDEYFDFSEAKLDKVDEVLLFSGGVDSLGGAVQEIYNDKRKVALVCHKSAPKLIPKRAELVEIIKNDAPRRRKPKFIHVWANKTFNPADRTQCTRSFLYASLAATVAVMFKLNRIRFYENGIVSVNLPVTDQVIGTMATRTTHPRTLKCYQTIFQILTDNPNFKVENPFFWKTKTDVINLIKDAGKAELISKTVSCSKTIPQTAKAPHCGVCSQCIERRLSSIAADCVEYDPSNLYEKDIFTGEQVKREDKILVNSYVMKYRQIYKSDEFKFFYENGEIQRVLSYLDGDYDDLAQRTYELFKRHSQQVHKATAWGIEQNLDKIQLGEFSPNCLLKYIVGDNATSLEITENFKPSQDFRSICWNGQVYELTETQAVVVKTLYENYLNMTPILSQNTLLEGMRTKRLEHIFKNSPLWKTLIVPGSGKGTYQLKIL